MNVIRVVRVHQTGVLGTFLHFLKLGLLRRSAIKVQYFCYALFVEEQVKLNEKGSIVVTTFFCYIVHIVISGSMLATATTTLRAARIIVGMSQRKITDGNIDIQFSGVDAFAIVGNESFERVVECIRRLIAFQGTQEAWI